MPGTSHKSGDPSSGRAHRRHGRAFETTDVNLLRQLNGKNLTILLTTHYMEEAQSLCNRVALMDHGKLEEINTPSGLIDSLGKYTVDQETPEGAKSHYFHSREEVISFLSSLNGQCTLRETTLEDVFVERAQARHLMQRYSRRQPQLSYNLTESDDELSGNTYIFMGKWVGFEGISI